MTLNETIPANALPTYAEVDASRTLTFPNGYQINYTFRVTKLDEERDLQVERRDTGEGIVWVLTRISDPVFGAINCLFTAREAYELFRIF